MTKGQHLRKLVDESDFIGVMAWLEDFAYWFDPGGWFSADECKRKFWTIEATELDRERIAEQLLGMSSEESFKKEYECRWDSTPSN